MSYYRDVYLKSDDWNNLRRAALWKGKQKCVVCKKKSPDNDVHHMEYRNLWDVKVNELKILCRMCHDKVHAIMAKYPKMKTLHRIQRWSFIRKHLNKDRRIKQAQKRHATRIRVEAMPDQLFSKYRSELVKREVVFKKKMPFSEALRFNPVFLSSLVSADAMLEAYIRITKSDPRRGQE